MEIKDIYKKTIKYKKYLLISLILGGLFGIFIYFLPSKYVAAGSFFINRKTSEGSEFFTYEGYYGQQAALSYTNSILSLMEGVDIKKMVLESNKMPLTGKNMNILNRMIRVKKTGPQVITLSVKANTYEQAKKLWSSVSDITLVAAYEMGTNGDPNISISKISPQPFVVTPYKSIYLFGIAGSLLSFAFSSFIICLKEYFKN